MHFASPKLRLIHNLEFDEMDIDEASNSHYFEDQQTEGYEKRKR